VLLVAFPDNAYKLPWCRALRQGDILHGQASDLVDARAELPGQSDHDPVPGASFSIVQEALFHKLVKLGDRDILASFDADGAAAARGLGHQAALGGLDNGIVLFGRKQAAQGGIIQEEVADAVDIPAQEGQDAGDARGGVYLSR
jgi:hypothetical protein